MEFVMPIIRTTCPENMKGKKCPVREYVEKGQNVLHVSINETYLIPNTNDIKKIFRTVVKMHKICDACKFSNNQKTK